jgi:hypothetical protein
MVGNERIGLCKIQRNFFLSADVSVGFFFLQVSHRYRLPIIIPFFEFLLLYFV